MNAGLRGLALALATPVLLLIHLADAFKRRAHRKHARH